MGQANTRENDSSTRFPSRYAAFALLLPILLAFPYCSWGGEYHSSLNNTLFCDECHRLSPVHEPGADQVGDVMDSSKDGSNNSVQKDENEVCLSCHDNNPGFSDVVGSNMGRSPGIVREAGALNIVGGAYPYRESNGHTLGSEAPAPGSSPPWVASGGLKCIDCHDPHGDNPNGNAFRNLTTSPGHTNSPGMIITYSKGANDPSRDVYLRSASTYDVSNVDFNEPSPNSSAIADFCKGCHNDFHGRKGGIEVGGAGGTGWHRHPSGDADIGRVGVRHSSRKVFSGDGTGKVNYVKVITGTGDWSPTSAADVKDHSPTCLSCHKAHGNRNPFGLVFMADRGELTEEGSPGGKYEDLCRQCHLQSIALGNPASR